MKSDGTMESRPLDDMAPFLNRDEYFKNILNTVAKKLGISHQLLSKRINDGLPEESWTQSSNPYEIEYQGKIYPSIPKYDSVSTLNILLRRVGGKLTKRFRLCLLIPTATNYTSFF